MCCGIVLNGYLNWNSFLDMTIKIVPTNARMVPKVKVRLMTATIPPRRAMIQNRLFIAAKPPVIVRILSNKMIVTNIESGRLVVDDEDTIDWLTLVVVFMVTGTARKIMMSSNPLNMSSRPPRSGFTDL